MAGIAAGFAPVEAGDARALILGSLPGALSIVAQQYYAHPRNAFWPIIAELLGVDGDYASRCTQLITHRIALWDILKQSPRPGSMDADIRAESSEPNDLPGFLHDHPQLCLVVFNGRKAEQLYRRFFRSDRSLRGLVLTGAPSTSAAYAAMSFSDKLDRWATALAPVISQPGEEP